ncbi:MAG TPA: acyltransferase [Gammaproteobacteria bacterium]|nr:acyltransferase [Gammaproteobacteria bacterium]
MIVNRNHGLDTLRAVAIILVFMFHCFLRTNIHTEPEVINQAGWAGVDLFFVLSGYLIGNQIFASFLNNHSFSLKTFYLRRWLRTLPNYVFVLGLYFLIPVFRDQPFITPLWKFLTFTQNFGLQLSSYSQAWSLCIEEQFYLFLPLIAIGIVYKGNIRTGWFLVSFIIVGGIILRSALWFAYIPHAGTNIYQIYLSKIYYPTFCRLDGLTLGVAIAMLKSFHKTAWSHVIRQGHWLMILGLLGCYLTFYPLEQLYGLNATALSYFFRSLSFAALVLAALSPKTLLHRVKVPGATTLATLAYAIYLTHLQLMSITQRVLFHWHIDGASAFTVIMEMLVCFAGSWILYTCVELPFLKLRENLGKETVSDLPRLQPKLESGA